MYEPYIEINQGSIEINERPLSAISPAKLSQIIAYIPQTEEARTGLTVFDTVLLGRKPYISGKPSAHDLEFVSELLFRLELEEEAMRTINTLSGGQQQRVFIAGPWHSNLLFFYWMNRLPIWIYTIR